MIILLTCSTTSAIIKMTGVMSFCWRTSGVLCADDVIKMTGVMSFCWKTSGVLCADDVIKMTGDVILLEDVRRFVC